MLLIDVNVLLAAHRDDHPDFAVSRPWLAELATEYGCAVVSFDSDFARFPALAWHRPS